MTSILRTRVRTRNRSSFDTGFELRNVRPRRAPAPDTFDDIFNDEFAANDDFIDSFVPPVAEPGEGGIELSDLSVPREVPREVPIEQLGSEVLGQSEGARLNPRAQPEFSSGQFVAGQLAGALTGAGVSAAIEDPLKEALGETGGEIATTGISGASGGLVGTLTESGIQTARGGIQALQAGETFTEGVLAAAPTAAELGIGLAKGAATGVASAGVGFAGDQFGQWITRQIQAGQGVAEGRRDEIHRTTVQKDVGAATGAVASVGAAGLAVSAGLASTGILAPVAALVALGTGISVLFNHLHADEEARQLALRRSGVLTEDMTDDDIDELESYYMSRITNPPPGFNADDDLRFRQGETAHYHKVWATVNSGAHWFKKYGLGHDSKFYQTSPKRLGKIFLDDEYTDPNTGEVKQGYYAFDDPEMREYVKKMVDVLLEQKPADVEDQDWVSQNENKIMTYLNMTLAYYEHNANIAQKILWKQFEQGPDPKTAVELFNRTASNTSLHVINKAIQEAGGDRASLQSILTQIGLMTGINKEATENALEQQRDPLNDHSASHPLVAHAPSRDMMIGVPELMIRKNPEDPNSFVPESQLLQREKVDFHVFDNIFTRNKPSELFEDLLPNQDPLADIWASEVSHHDKPAQDVHGNRISHTEDVSESPLAHKALPPEHSGSVSRHELEESHMKVDKREIWPALALAAAAYEDVHSFRMFRDLTGSIQPPRRAYIPLFNTSAVLWSRQDSQDPILVIGVNGTRFKTPTGEQNIVNALTDLAALPQPSQMTVGSSRSSRSGVPTLLHTGFVSVARALLNTVIPKLLEGIRVKENTKLIFTGHSLGGAVALLLGTSKQMVRWAKDHHLKGINVITFGAPRVGNETFASSIENEKFIRVERFSTDCDPVVRVPPSFMGYVHTGLERLLHKGGDFTNLFKDGQRPHNTEKPSPSIFNVKLKCHGLAHYRATLTNMFRHMDSHGIDLNPLRMPTSLAPDESTESLARFHIDSAVEDMHGTLFSPERLHQRTTKLANDLNVSPFNRRVYDYLKQQLFHRVYASNHHRNTTALAWH